MHLAKARHQIPLLNNICEAQSLGECGWKEKKVLLIFLAAFTKSFFTFYVNFSFLSQYVLPHKILLYWKGYFIDQR